MQNAKCKNVLLVSLSPCLLVSLPGRKEHDMDTITVTFKLNGKTTALAVTPLTTLRTALREHLHQHATKAGCGQGGCGSGTVLGDGEPALSCLLPLALVEGQEVATLEGIGAPGRLHPLQEAFHDH